MYVFFDIMAKYRCKYFLVLSFGFRKLAITYNFERCGAVRYLSSTFLLEKQSGSSNRRVDYLSRTSIKNTDNVLKQFELLSTLVVYRLSNALLGEYSEMERVMAKYNAE